MSVADQLRQLEQELLEGSVRRNAPRVTELLAEDFREFGSSGRVFTRQEIVDALQAEAPARFFTQNFQLTMLASHVALVTYESSKETADGLVRRSLRSSIWQLADDGWRMVFHQGTNMAPH